MEEEPVEVFGGVVIRKTLSGTRYPEVNLDGLREKVYSFCNCPAENRDGGGCLVCGCGEDPEGPALEWNISLERVSPRVQVDNDGTNVLFHEGYSTGTAVCSGTRPLERSRQHYWEIRLTQAVYGTAIVVGVGQEDVVIDQHGHSFEPLLGKDAKSWGYCYLGDTIHNGVSRPYANRQRWRQGSILGVHLDLERGTMEYYLNREPLGVAFKRIPLDVPLYPLVASTASRSGFRLIFARSYSSLAFQCIKTIARAKSRRKLLAKLATVPGLNSIVEKNYWFLLGTRKKKTKEEEAAAAAKDKAKVMEIVSSDDNDDPKGLEAKPTTSGRRQRNRRKGPGNRRDDSSDGEDICKLFHGDAPASGCSSNGRRPRPKRNRLGANKARKNGKDEEEDDDDDSSDFLEFHNDQNPDDDDGAGAAAAPTNRDNSAGGGTRSDRKFKLASTHFL